MTAEAAGAATPSGGFVTAGGRRLEYRWLGPSPAETDEPVLVVLHEGLGSVSLWRDFPDRIAEATGLPVLVYSRAGYGRSDPADLPRGVRYMHVEALEVLPELLDRFRVRRAILIGHSDGASIALIHAGGAAARARIAGVVCLAPHVFNEELCVASIREAKIAYETTDLPARLGRHHADPEHTFRGWNDIWLHPDFWHWNIEEFLPSIGVPVMVVQGEDDEYGTIAQVEAIEAQVPGPVERVLLPACRHSPHRDQPAATLDAVTRFVASIRPTP